MHRVRMLGCSPHSATFEKVKVMPEDPRYQLCDHELTVRSLLLIGEPA